MGARAVPGIAFPRIAHVEILGQSNLPMILPSSGTIGNNGALSALTALNATYTSAYLYFPVNAIAAGVAAGLYYCVMSSTTAGTIYNNVYDPTLGVLPTIPGVPTAFVTTGPGAYTQTTSTDITVLGLTVPGNSIGSNGQLRIGHAWANNNTAGSKTWTVAFGGTAGRANTVTTTLAVNDQFDISNAANAKQKWSSASTAAAFGATAVGVGTSTVDTTADQLLIFRANLTVATDHQCCETALVELMYGS